MPFVDKDFEAFEQAAIAARDEATSAADQLAWDRFAAGALVMLANPTLRVSSDKEAGADAIAIGAAVLADRLMLERAKRLTPRKG